MNVPLQTTVVGSYPVPDWLKTSPSLAARRDAMRLVLDAQERAGIDVIGDGELGRWDLDRREPAGMVERFIRPMTGVQIGLNRKQREAFLSDPATAYRATAPGVVTNDLGDGRLDLLQEFTTARQLTDRPLKFTLTSPYMLAKVAVDDHYHDLQQLSKAFAGVLATQLQGVDAEVIQIDEPHLPGHPDEGKVAASCINHVFDAVQPSSRKAVHLCFGNFGGQMIQRGDYESLIEFLNQLHCDHVVLETTRRSDDEIQSLKQIDQRIGLGVGVIDVKDLQIESPEVVARRIETLANCLGAERLHFVHPDCGLQVLPRSIADGKLRALVAGRNLFVGSGVSS